MSKGKLVVIDGLDGSGKKTQLDLLLAYCQSHNIKTSSVDFPQYYDTFFGRLCGRYLKGEFGNLKTTSPYLVSLAFAGDRWQAKTMMEKALRQGKLLLANRYVTSNMAFQAGKFIDPREQKKFIKWEMELEYKIYGLPKPDLQIYLGVPAQIGQKLVNNKGKRAYLANSYSKDIHENNLGYLERVGQIYHYLLKTQPNWVKIDCLDKKGKLKGRSVVHQEISQILRTRKIVVK